MVIKPQFDLVLPDPYISLLPPGGCEEPQFSSAQSLSHVWLLPTPWTAAYQASLSITNSRSLLKLMSIESVMPSNHLILISFSSHLQSFPASGSFPMSQLLASGGQSIGVSASISLNISISNEHSGLISFRMDWVDLLAVQGTLKSLLQHRRKHQSFSTQPYLWSNSYIHTWLLEKP